MWPDSFSQGKKTFHTAVPRWVKEWPEGWGWSSAPKCKRYASNMVYVWQTASSHLRKDSHTCNSVWVLVSLMYRRISWPHTHTSPILVQPVLVWMAMDELWMTGCMAFTNSGECLNEWRSWQKPALVFHSIRAQGARLAQCACSSGEGGSHARMRFRTSNTVIFAAHQPHDKQKQVYSCPISTGRKKSPSFYACVCACVRNGESIFQNILWHHFFPLMRAHLGMWKHSPSNVCILTFWPAWFRM